MRMKESAESRMDSQASETNVRLERLERENLRTKKIGIVAAVVASVFFISGQAKTDKVVEASEFRLVDSAGKVRALLSMTPAGPDLSFYDDGPWLHTFPRHLPPNHI